MDASIQLATFVLISFPRERLLIISPVLGVASLGYISFKYLSSHLWKSAKYHKNGKAKTTAYALDLFEVEDDDAAKRPVNERDGLVVLGFRIVRLLAVFALLSLAIFDLTDASHSHIHWERLFFYVYACALSCAAIASPTRWRDMANRQLAILLCVDFLVCFFLDAWPYATYQLYPFDPANDPITWTRLALLGLVGILITLSSLRPARPYKNADENTVSLFSRATYTYLDSIVFKAWRVPSLGIEDLPEVSDSEKAEYLRRKSFPNLDPTLLGRKRYLVWGMLHVFRWLYLGLYFWSLAENLAEFLAPFGMKNMLSYIETGVSPMGVRPWVWILVLGLGPVLKACCHTQYLYLGTRVDLECESVFTQLVFEHSLRIRLKSDALDKKDEKKDKDKTKKDSKGKSSVTSSQSGTGTATPATEGEVTPEEGDGDSATLVEAAEPALEGGHVKAKTGHLVGKINNLITTDAATIQSSYQAVTIPNAFIQILVAVAFLYELLGWSAFVGLGTIIVTLPLPTFVGKLIMKAQKDKMSFGDKRVQAVTETLGVLRMVKLFAWESHVLKEVADRREEELVQVKTGRILDISMNAVNSLMPLFAKLSTIIVYALIAKGDLSASRMFSALMVFSLMENQVWYIMYRIPEVLRSKVAWDRFDQFVNETEILESLSLKQVEASNVAAVQADYDRDAIGFNACTFSWDPFKELSDAESNSNPKRSRDQFFLRFDSEAKFKRGCINLIVGPTGSGKTSILMALLGEMYYRPDSISSWFNLPRESGIAYAAQESWVLNETIRDNILLGEPYEEQRYKNVLKQCSLERDLSLWEAGDMTEVGEKGLTLSGGQKARVTLARALYSRASILLLDDILAALDVHTAKWVVGKALSGDLVEGRTVLLVTHNIALAAPIAEYVVVLGGNGSVTSQGSVADVLKRDDRLRRQAAEVRTKAEDIETEFDEKIKEKDDEQDTSKQASGKLVVAEEKALGRVKWAALKVFTSAVGGPLVWFLMIGSWWASSCVNIYQRWVMGYWTSQYDTHAPSEVPVVLFLALYASGSILEIVADSAIGLLWVYRTLRASRIIHARLLKSIFSSTFRWLDITPVGRIITRSTQDINAIDGPFTHMLNPFIQISVHIVTLFVSSVVMAGWSAFISGLILIVLGGFLGRVYLLAQIGIRREMSNAKAPVMSQVSTVLGGIISIRAYSAQRLFRRELKKRVDNLMRASLTFYDINRWVSVRIDSLGGLFAAAVTTYFVYGSNISAGYVGFTLSMVFSFSQVILYWVRIYNFVEVQANSLERVRDFLVMDHEPEPTDQGKPPAYWPSSGGLRVENLAARYSDDSPEVLSDVSFEIASGERVGVVGRTGAGKSSVTLALLRAIKTSGKVYYDGLATDEINLESLRSNITLIPQQPELMHGTLRENLDPFGHHDDATLNDALQAAGLFSLSTPSEGEQEAEPDGQAQSQAGSSSESASIASNAAKDAPKKIGLDTMVESGGTNFSLGQRQIIALARAIVRRSKLLILDEATAAIDYETDTAIQKTLRTEFGKDTTFITIAHRLQTIMDSDKIMVLEAGRLVEFDSPQNLLAKDSGLFRALVDESEDRDALMKLAGVQ